MADRSQPHRATERINILSNGNNLRPANVSLGVAAVGETASEVRRGLADGLATETK